MFLAFALLVLRVFDRSVDGFGLHTRVNCPTRNMSYDLRGEAYVNHLTNFPFNNASLSPGVDCIRNKAIT
jgi:hypothetical protein